MLRAAYCGATGNTDRNHARPAAQLGDGKVQRDPHHETHLTTIAAQAVGLTAVDHTGQVVLVGAAAQLNALALSRALPGPVQLDNRNLIVDALEEVADLRNYCCWHVQRFLEPALRGDEHAAYEYERGMRALAASLTVAPPLFEADTS